MYKNNTLWTGIKFTLSSLSASVIDVGIFTICTYGLKDIMPACYILVATVLARIVSSLYNFTINKKAVFNKEGDTHKSLVKYYMLVVIQMLASAGGVWLIHHTINKNESMIKILVDVMLFFVSFWIQRLWVFKEKR